MLPTPRLWDLLDLTLGVGLIDKLNDNKIGDFSIWDSILDHIENCIYESIGIDVNNPASFT